MSWIEISLHTTPEAVDWIRTLLAQTADISQMRVTPVQPDPPESTGEQTVTLSPWAFTLSFYLPYDHQAHSRVDAIESLLAPLNRTGLTTALETYIVETPPPTGSDPSLVHRVGQRFLVMTEDLPCPTVTGDEVVLRLKTSLAFGSGFHPATMLCLRLIERWVAPGQMVLDLGSGSGILSVAIAKLGATVLALDNDATAVQATQEAAQLNHVEAQVTVMEGSLGRGSTLGHWMGGTVTDTVQRLEAAGQFDVIVANVLARVHTALAPEFYRALRNTGDHRGLLITAGFTTDHEQDVQRALADAGFEQITCERLNEWVAFAHQIPT